MIEAGTFTLMITEARADAKRRGFEIIDTGASKCFGQYTARAITPSQATALSPTQAALLEAEYEKAYCDARLRNVRRRAAMEASK